MIKIEGIKEINIFTPCYNSEKYILRTVNSVINQKAVIEGRVKLNYYILDGNSTDNTLSLLKEVKSNRLTIISEEDNGMYDALSKGLKKITNGWCAYLNAGDYYHPLAFDIILDFIEKYPSIKWVTGYSAFYSDQGYPINFKLPFKFRRSLIQRSAYDGKLPFIQQESTFWDSNLNELLDLDFLSNLQMAGDYYLWVSFSKKYPLHIIEAYLGGFCIHPGQASENIKDYRKELLKFCSLLYPWDWLTILFDNIMWFMPARAKRKLNKQLHKYSHVNASWD